MIRGAYRPRMLPLDDTAAIIARACGVMGSNRAELERMAHQLQMLGIQDNYVTQLLHRVQAHRTD